MKKNTSKNIPDGAVERFQTALRIRTDWPTESDEQATAQAQARLIEFQQFLASAYPHFNAVAQRFDFDPFAIAYCWKAQEPNPSLQPVLFLAHYDVVPVEEKSWTQDPFGAEIKDGFIWARGTLDTKQSLICAIEAAEALAAAGFKPQRDLWFAFGGDEERSGFLGAHKVADFFAKQNINFSFLLDEGSVIVDGLLANVKTPLALIGIEEKGFLDIELTVVQQPGHASRPPRVQAAAVLGRALDRLSRKPFPWKLTPGVEAFFKKLSTQVSFPSSLVLGNPRSFGPLFFKLAGASKDTAALMRTTVAMTQLQGSRADNVLPSAVKAILNLRLLPGWTIEEAVAYVKNAIADDRVDVAVYSERIPNNPLPSTPEAAAAVDEGWNFLNSAINTTFPDIPVLPFLVTATTDSRHYASVCKNLYRFAPMVLNSAELDRIHGHDERISLDNFESGIVFYRSLISQL